jgi:hypothetical protein
MYGRRRVTVTWTPELGHDGFLNWRRHRAKLWKLLGIQSARRAKIVLDIDDSVISLTNSPPARPAKPFIFD